MDRTHAAGLLQDLGGHGPVLHLGPANGFPPGTCRLLAEALGEACRVVAATARPLWAGNRPSQGASWRPLADDAEAIKPFLTKT
jgi:hypothetical protein